MLNQKSEAKQLRQQRHSAGSRRLRWAIKQAVASFQEANPQWGDYFFDTHFLLNRGLPIIEKHLAGASSTGAIDLALAWAEEWPSMTMEQRKACLQLQTVMAAELLQLVTESLLARPSLAGSAKERNESWRGVGVPLAYIQAHNPPTRSEMNQAKMAANSN